MLWGFSLVEASERNGWMVSILREERREKRLFLSQAPMPLAYLIYPSFSSVSFSVSFLPCLRLSLHPLTPTLPEHEEPLHQSCLEMHHYKPLVRSSNQLSASLPSFLSIMTSPDVKPFFLRFSSPSLSLSFYFCGKYTHDRQLIG